MKKIDLKKIIIKNFLSIGNDPVEISFHSGLNIITGVNKDSNDRANGVGKSTIYDAIYFVIYGEILRDIGNKNVSNKFTKKGAAIRLEFSVDSDGVVDEYTITRQLSPSKVFLVKNNEDITLDSIENTDVKINNIIGMTSDVFKSCVMMGMNSMIPFLAKKKIDKKKFIEGLFDLEVFSKILKDSREASNQLSTNIHNLSLRINDINNDIASNKERSEAFLLDIKTKLAEYEKKNFEINQKILDTNKQIANLVNLNEKDEILEITEKKKQLSDVLVRNNNTLDEIISNKVKLSSNISILKKKIQDNIELNAKKQKLVKEYSEFCNTTVLSDEKFIETINVLTLNNTENEKKIEELTKNVQKIVEKIVELQSKIKYNEEKIKNVVSDGTCPTCLRPITEEDKNKILFTVDEYKSSIEKFKSNIQQLEAKKLEFVNVINEHKKTIIDNNKSIDSNKTNISNVKNNVYKKQILEKNISDIKIDDAQDDSKIKELENLLSELNVKETDIKKSTITTRTMIENLDVRMTEIQNNRVKIDALKRVYSQYSDMSDDLKREKDSIKNKINPFDEILKKKIEDASILNKTLEEYNKEKYIHEKLKFIASEEGVKSFLMKKLLGLLNSKISEYLVKLGNHANCSFNEFFEESITNIKGLECEYNNFSGAERKSIDLACMFAFMDILRLRGTVQFNCLFFDELFDSSVDAQGIELIVNILDDRCKKYDEKIYVISHNRNVTKYITGEIIELIKENNVTRLT